MDRMDEVVTGPGDNVLARWREYTDGNSHTWVRKLIANWCRENCRRNADVFALLETAFRHLEQDSVDAGGMTPEMCGRRALLSMMLYVAIEVEFGKGILDEIKACL